MGLDDVLKKEVLDRIDDIKPKLVQEFDELTQRDLDEAGDDPDAMVDKIQQKTGQPRQQVEEKVRQVAAK